MVELVEPMLLPGRLYALTVASLFGETAAFRNRVTDWMNRPNRRPLIASLTRISPVMSKTLLIYPAPQRRSLFESLGGSRRALP